MASPEPQDENQCFIVLRRFRDQPDAFLSRSLLDSAEIECYLADENTIRMDWFWSNLLGRIKLCVRKADADTASSLLGQNVPEKFDVEGLGEYQQPRCPKCLSLEGFLSGIEQASATLVSSLAGRCRFIVVFGNAIPVVTSGQSPAKNPQQIC